MPTNRNIYHIVHYDRLLSIINDGGLLPDSVMSQRQQGEPIIGMDHIKHRRLHELKLSTYPDLYVGDCVPFYFCPRSTMLYVIHRADSGDLTYHGGQEPVIHLVINLAKIIRWASSYAVRWAFTTSNAGSHYFEDFNTVNDLSKLNWQAIDARYWADPNIREAKQAEFLLEKQLPWHLVDAVGVYNGRTKAEVEQLLGSLNDYTPVYIQPSWYY